MTPMRITGIGVDRPRDINNGFKTLSTTVIGIATTVKANANCRPGEPCPDDGRHKNEAWAELHQAKHEHEKSQGSARRNIEKSETQARKERLKKSHADDAARDVANRRSRQPREADTLLSADAACQ